MAAVDAAAAVSGRMPEDAADRAGGGRGPFNGQFASFGNRRRTPPPVQGSLALTVRNSAFNAAPYSLNGQAAQKPYSANNNLTPISADHCTFPKSSTGQRAQYTVTFTTSLDTQRTQHGRFAADRGLNAAAISRRA